MKHPVVCSVGSTDPWNAAGVGLDVRALAECGARAVTVVAGVTAQDRLGVHAAAAVAPDLIEAQFAALAAADIRAYRIGALLDVASARVVAAQLRRARVPVVYDPVLAPSGGGTFASEAATRALAELLVPCATLVTPNLEEAGRLTPFTEPLHDVASMERAGEALRAAGAGAALVKGGHLCGAPVDVLIDAHGTVAYEAPRLGGSLRGTGCLLACAAAAALARDQPLRTAVEAARAFVREHFANARSLGGMSVAY